MTDSIIAVAEETFNGQITTEDNSMTSALDIDGNEIGGTPLSEEPKPVDNSLFATFSGYAPQPIEEKETSFGPRVLRGKYNGILMNTNRITGEGNYGPYDFYSSNIQITDTVDAKVSGENIYVKKTYGLTGDYAAQNIEKLLNEYNQYVGELLVEGTTQDEIADSISLKLEQFNGTPVTINVWPKLKKKKLDDGSWTNVEASEEDKEKGLPFNNKGELYKTDKNGYIDHTFKFATKVDLTGDCVTLD